jgi:hypothetical protein
VAWLDGSPEVTEEHLDVLKHCLWSQLEERGSVSAAVEKLAASVVTQAREVWENFTTLVAELPVVNKGDVTEDIQKKLIAANREAKRAQGALQAYRDKANTPRQKKAIDELIAQVDGVAAPVKEQARQALGL